MIASSRDATPSSRVAIPAHRDEAKRWLDKLMAYQPKGVANISWDDMVISIRRREVALLILGSRPAAPSPAASAPTKKAAGDPGAKPG